MPLPLSGPELPKIVWTMIFDLMMESADDRLQALERHGLTPNEARALWSIDEQDGRPIGSLAKTWRCDPSNVTFIIDRMEQAGLAEREPSKTDRRVKLVRLTKRGVQLKRGLLAAYRTPPAAFSRLSPDQLQAIASALSPLVGEESNAPGESAAS